MEDCKQTPLEDQRKQALEHYEDLSSEACHFSSFVKDAILAYNPTEDKKAHVERVKMKITKIGTKEGGFEFDGNGEGIGTQFNTVTNETLYGGYTVSELHQYVELRDKTRNEAIQDCIELMWLEDNGDNTAFCNVVEGVLEKLKKDS